LSAVAVGLIAFALILSSIAIGLMMRRWVPEAHISGDSKEVIRLATALIGTMAAVVLALLFASTRSSFEATNASVGRMTTSVIELDHMLREYGPEGQALRKALRQDVLAIVASIWQDDVTVQQQSDAKVAGAQVKVLTMLRQVTPANPLQAAVQARALSVSGDLEQTRLSLIAQPGDSLSKPFVIVLVLWLCFIFLSFSMSAKANTTLVVMLVICAFSASSAIYLILELEQPFDGLMQISNSALRNALPPLS
jgi:branched-subunit amino acid transport protein AzlD